MLTMDPDILIMDEPMSHVDQQGRENMLALMRRLRNAGKTVIVVEHDYEQLDFADQWVVLEAGKLKAMGPPEQLLERGLLL